MDLKGLASIHVMNDFTEQSENSLSLLYYPLIEKDAYIVYHILRSLDGMSINQEQLISLTHLKEYQFDKARSVCEEFNLIKTYFEPSSRKWLYIVQAPLEPQVFLQHEIYGRYYINVEGSQRYDYMKMRFSNEEKLDKGFINVSSSFDEKRMEQWSSQKENIYQDVKMTANYRTDYEFDFDEFLTGMDRIFPKRLQTPENLSKIARLASIHGISAKDMKKYVQRSTNPSTKEFDYNRLTNAVMYQNKSVRQKKQDPYDMAPVQFMASRQKGTPVSIADKKLIDYICENYSFPNDVVNVLIEYVLNTSNQQFSRAYVEKVASTWSRLSIDTRQKALEQCKTRTSSTSGLPDWYQDTAQEKPDEELLARMLEKQKKMKGDSQ